MLNDRGTTGWQAGHPWVFAGAILGWEPEPPPDDHTAPVGVRSRRGPRLGIADFSPHSQIRLRKLGSGAELAPNWLEQRLEAALAWRKRVVESSDAYRLVSAEGDHLPGLIVDRYGSGISVQTLTWAMAARQEAIVAWLEQRLAPRTIAERNDIELRRREGLEPRAGLLRGTDATCEFEVHGLRLEADLLAGQKTGGFLDQRENWLAVEGWARRLGCATALDAFTYQGGFALHLARACGRVEAGDSSRPALEIADRNAVRNRLENIEWIEANAFELLREHERAGRRFDCVVLDPPAFAKSRDTVDQAAGAYKEINLRALKLLAPGGLLVSCSCSHHMTESRLLEVIAAAADDARREVTLLERRAQALDHPVLLAAPETSYLKCVVARVT